MALVAAAGVIVGGVAMPSAKAADLGGDCCADLEERVAELEATTARKGNRKVSLTITGQVNRTILWVDDGSLQKTYIGLDNTASSTRWAFLGSARISPKMSAGFEILWELEGGNKSSAANQFDEDGKISTAAPLGTNVSFNGPNVDNYAGDMRRGAVWLEHKDLGRLTLGRYEGTGTPYTIDLGGIAAVASGSKAIRGGGGFYIRESNTGNLTNILWGNTLDPIGTSGGAGGRVELLRYDSPAFMGFILSSHIAETGNYWGVQLRYAGEFSGVRIAAHVGMDQSTDRATPAVIDPGNAAFGLLTEPEVNGWGAALSVMHVPTGLFLQGHYYRISFDGFPIANGYRGSVTPAAGTFQLDGEDWMVQGGLAKNWFGWGNTALYGEYGKSLGWAGTTGAGRSFPGASACGTPPFEGICTQNLQGIAGVTDSEATLWGIGVVQNIDAAAMEIYLGYRRYSIDLSGATLATTTVTTTGTSASATATSTGVAASFDDMQIIELGTRIKF
jgi:hypothetical protein